MGATIRPGASEHAYSDITVHTYRPASFTPESRIVVVMHGRRRNGAEYRDFWIAESERQGFLVVTPEFSEARYPHPHRYNYAGMVRADGALAPRNEWLFPMIDEVFRDAVARTGSKRGQYAIFGHSAGAQFVHRFVTFAWSPLIERAVAANAGSYTMPQFGEEFPFGLGGLTDLEVDRRALFSRPLVVLLGDRDIDPGDEHLPREPGAMRQGPHRFARGNRYMEVARQEAERIGSPLAWRLAVVPGVAHSGREMSPFAAREL
jgi:poly(3-hydroxybutyrate) depolymerase